MQINFVESAYTEGKEFLEQAFAPTGWCSKLLRPIGKVSVYPQKVAAAFGRFVEKAVPEKTFSVAELIAEGEFLLARNDAGGAAGDGIFVLEAPVEDVWLRRMLFSHSVCGLAALLAETGGAELTLPAGKTPDKLMSMRFCLLRKKDSDNLLASPLVKLTRVGTVCPGKLSLEQSGQKTALALDEVLSAEPLELTIGSADTQAFDLAYEAAVSHGLCCHTAGDYFINLPADLSMEQLLAGALGCFDAMLRYRIALPPQRFLPNTKIGLTVPRPQVTVGDSVYAFRPKADGGGRPLPAELQRLQQYLATNVKNGKIKCVLPLKKNALSMMERLCDDGMAYVPERDFPTEVFTVLAIVNNTEGVLGTRMGAFQSI